MSSTDSVSVAFELMLHELSLEVSDLNERGAGHFRTSEYEMAQSLSQSGKALADFRSRVVTLQGEWLQRFSGLFVDREPAQDVEQTARTIASASKSPKTRLRIRFADGVVLDERTAALSFAKAIEHIGFQNVMKLGIKVNREALVATTSSPLYNDTYVGGLYVRTHSSTKDKRDDLMKIADALGVKISVEVI